MHFSLRIKKLPHKSVLISFRNNQEGRIEKKKKKKTKGIVIAENPRKNRTGKEKAKVWFSNVLYKEKHSFHKVALILIIYKRST